jgi:uncharacterized membrane protein YebE (DUF533 family)
MANFGDLLGSLMQNGMSPSGQGRMGNVLNDLQSGLGKMTQGQGGAGGVLGKVLDAAKTTLGNAAQNPLQAGGIGAVLGSLIGGGGKSVSGAVKGGALAVLAGLAYQAFANASQGAAPAPAPAGVGGDLSLGMQGPQTAAQAHALEGTAALVIRGMIAIAKSDGQVSADETQRIVGKLKESGMGDEAQAWMLDQLRQPLDLDALVAAIPSPEVAAQVYAASLLAVEVDTPQERQYLADFVRKTRLDPAVAKYIQSTLGVTV